MTIQYITDENGNIVAQFDGNERDPIEGHESHIVESINDLPGVDEWEREYLK